MSDVTRLLEAARGGDPSAAAELLPLVYAELRKLAAARLAREQPGHTLDATALVHEAYLRLIGSNPAEPRDDQQFDGRGHFFAAAAEAMRRILVEQARKRLALKRGAAIARDDLDLNTIAAPTPDAELIALHEALERLEVAHPDKAAIVKLRYFAGMTADEAATALGVSPSTGDRHWAYARAWLRRELDANPTALD
jgi:RNA polymerase sigma factor (TIGR02999 family)